MPKLTDLVDTKLKKWLKSPTMVVQEICPADDVSASIIEHSNYRFQLTSMTALTVGPHGGRMLLIYAYQGGAVNVQ
ncbi:hypothetical protein BH11CYA1_BH11CYA1_09780 [soil metagenome]